MYQETLFATRPDVNGSRPVCAATVPVLERLVWDHGRHTLTITGLSASEIAALVPASRAGPIEVRFRIPTPDRRLAAALEPGLPPPSMRFAALRAARRAGLDAGVLVAPLLPGVNDVECDLARLLHEAHRSGAAFVTFTFARQSERSGQRLVSSLREKYPRAAARLEVRRLLARREPDEDQAAIEATLRRLAASFRLPFRAPFSDVPRPHADSGLQRSFSFAGWRAH